MDIRPSATSFRRLYLTSALVQEILDTQMKIREQSIEIHPQDPVILARVESLIHKINIVPNIIPMSTFWTSERSN